MGARGCEFESRQTDQFEVEYMDFKVSEGYAKKEREAIVSGISRMAAFFLKNEERLKKESLERLNNLKERGLTILNSNDSSNCP